MGVGKKYLPFRYDPGGFQNESLERKGQYSSTFKQYVLEVQAV